MDPITWMIVGVLAWVVTAPDPYTASVRSGAAGAIGSGARAAAQSIRSDVQSGADGRSKAHAARVDRWKAKATDSWKARAALKADQLFGRGGLVESVGRRIGAHGQAAIQAGRVGWESSRTQGRRGLPEPIRSRLAPLASEVADRLRRAHQPSPVAPANQSSSAPSGGKKEAVVASQQKLAELTNTDALRAEVKTLGKDVEAASLAVLVLEKWTGALPERYAAADFGTKGIGTAVQAAGEASTGLAQARAAVIHLNEVLAQMRKAIEAADQIGQVAAEQDAKGDVKGYQPA